MEKNMDIINDKVLVTGGAGFIGSNLCDELLHQGYEVVCLDNFSTGHLKNIKHLIDNPRFTLMIGDIRNYDDCLKAVDGVKYILHQAALGSVPRSIKDPITSNTVNVSGFLNMLHAAKENNIKRFVYAASSSTYGDSTSLPKVEDVIGKPLSPYAVTKYVNELYADVFSRTYGIECIGLRYFNVFGARQDPDGAYAAVIPLFVKQLINHQSPMINGDGNYSRDFTYIKNVVQMNLLAMTSDNADAVNNVYNTAFGERTNLNELFFYLRKFLSKFDSDISKINVNHGPNRLGDIPHSLANVDKAKKLLNYNPQYSIEQGLEEAIEWYWENLK